MHGMMSYFLRRILLIPITFVCITFLVYTVLRIVPGGPIEQAKMRMKAAAAGETGAAAAADDTGGDTALPEEAVKELEEYYNLADSVPVGYLKWLLGYYAYVPDPDELTAEEHWSRARAPAGVTVSRSGDTLALSNPGSGEAVVTLPFASAKDFELELEARVTAGRLTVVFLHLPPSPEGPLARRSFYVDPYRSRGGPEGRVSYLASVYLHSRSLKVVDHQKMLVQSGEISKDVPDSLRGEGLELRLAPGTEAELHRLDLTRDEDFSLFASYAGLVRSWFSGGKPKEYWHHGIITGGFGTSYIRGDPVLDVILSKIPISMYFGLIGFFSTYIVCIPLGVTKAIKHKSVFDTSTSILVFAGYSTPGFVACLILLVIFGGGTFFDLLPLGGFQSADFDQLSFFGKVLDRIHHLIIPLTGYLITGFATMTILMKNSLLDNMGADYVRTAFAKGLSERRVIFLHAMRNSLIPVTAGLGHALGLLFAGSFLIEKTCNIPGMGLLGYTSVIQRDYPIIMATLVIGVLIRLSGNIFSDIIWAFIDPRIRFR